MEQTRRDVTIDIRILGPVELAVDGSPVHIGGDRPLTLLAALAIDIGHAVPVDRLILDVWDDDLPDAAEADLQSHISKIRSAIGACHLTAGDHSYTLDLDPEAVDAVRFERLTLEAERLLPDDPQAALDACIAGMRLWRGAPFGSLAELPFLQPAANRLLELRSAVIEIRLEADLALGRHVRAIPMLETLVGEYPYRERIWFLLADALARDGRRVEALRSLRRLERELGEVGLSPSRELRELEQQIIDEVPPHVARLSRHR
jgi:DNA-binding SARP family transcriptional activator